MPFRARKTCFEWQYGICGNAENGKCKKEHRCESCNKENLQHFGKEDRCCNSCFYKTCLKTIATETVLMILFVLNIVTDFYTGIYYITIGHLRFASVTIGWLLIAWLLSTYRSLRYAINDRKLKLQQDQKHAEAKNPNVCWKWTKKLYSYTFMYPLMSLFGPAWYHLKTITFTVTKNIQLRKMVKAVTRTRSPFSVFNDTVQIFIQFYICNRINAFTVMHLATISTSIISAASNISDIVSGNRIECVEAYKQIKNQSVTRPLDETDAALPSSKIKRALSPVSAKRRRFQAVRVKVATVVAFGSKLFPKKFRMLRDLVTIALLLCVYPMSIIRGATHLHEPWHILALGGVALAVLLVLVDTRYCLFLGMEFPIDLSLPTYFNRYVLDSLQTYLTFVQRNHGLCLFLKMAYHLMVFFLAQAFLAYWFFFRSLRFRHLSHAEHLIAFDKEFEDDLRQFSLTQSCREFLRNTTFTGLPKFKKLFDGCYAFASGGCEDHDHLFAAFILVFTINMFFAVFWNSRVRDGIKSVGNVLRLAESKRELLEKQNRNHRVRTEFLVEYPVEKRQAVAPMPSDAPRWRRFFGIGAERCRLIRNLGAELSRLTNGRLDAGTLESVACGEEEARIWRGEVDEGEQTDVFVIRFKTKASHKLFQKVKKRQTLTIGAEKVPCVFKPMEKKYIERYRERIKSKNKNEEAGEVFLPNVTVS